MALGATAAKALLGSSFRVTRERGKLLDSEDLALVAEALGGAGTGMGRA